jgi:transposase
MTDSGSIVWADRNAIASSRMSAHTSAKKIQDLIKLKAIGPETATALAGEEFYRPFKNRRRLASYVGLTPNHLQSGSTCRDQGIRKAGNPKARTTMIELAWLWLRHQPDSAFSVWFRERVGNLKGRIRRITIVAMARMLLIALWRYLETGVVPAGAVLKVKNHLTGLVCSRTGRGGASGLNTNKRNIPIQGGCVIVEEHG